MNAVNTPPRNAPPERIRFKLEGRSIKLDNRVHAARGDLADVSLAGVLFSAHYARAIELTCIAPGASVLAAASPTATAVSELLRGESFHALDITTDWAWGFCGHDGYVGYVRRDALDSRESPTHRIVASAAPLFSAPDIKAPIVDYWSRGVLFTGEEQGTFIACGDGFVHERHAAPVNGVESDWVAVAMHYLGQPYVWGGRGHRGVDCSGLVQVALGRCGVKAPRDTDLQREAIGSEIEHGAPLRRGDFVFFPGHVGIMTDGENLLHATAHWMSVVVEPLADVTARLRPDVAEPIIALRRIGA